MRFALTIVAVPLVLLAACAKATPADEATPEPMAASTETAVPVTLPTIPVNSVTTIKYPGNYSRGAEHLRLNSDNTYELTRSDGTVVTGTYSQLPDNNRIRLQNFEDGKPAYFSVGNGAIYRQRSASTPPRQITVQGEYKREPDVPTGTTPRPSPSPSPTGG